MDETVRQHKFVLDESEMPTPWYNLVPDLPSPPPPALHPGTLQPVGPDDLAPLFPMDLILQEVSTDRYVEIPGEVLDVYRQWRPSPLYRAHRLEQALETPARIYYKYEGVSPGRQPQAQHRGAPGLLQRQGGGQEADHRDRGGPVGHGAGLRLRPVRPGVRGVAGRGQLRPEALPPDDDGDLRGGGAPLAVTADREPGGVLAEDPDPRLARDRHLRGGRGGGPDPETRLRAGSVLNHVLLHQTIIGEEALLQLARPARRPTWSSAARAAARTSAACRSRSCARSSPGKMSPVIRAVEPASCPSLTHGVYAYDFGDAAGMTPLMKMHTLGHDFVPDPIHAGGLRYHGMSPLVSPRVRARS